MENRTITISAERFCELCGKEAAMEVLQKNRWGKDGDRLSVLNAVLAAFKKEDKQC